jgi:hypothetical protein
MKSQTEGKKNYSKEFENMLGNPIEQVDRLIKQAHNLITGRGGATTKVSREGATLKHTAKVRPLQEFIQTETTYGITTVKVLNDFWNWSKEVTNSINEIIDHLNSMEEGK